jgi:hypothetical protein
MDAAERVKLKQRFSFPPIDLFTVGKVKKQKTNKKKTKNPKRRQWLTEFTWMTTDDETVFCRTTIKEVL